MRIGFVTTMTGSPWGGSEELWSQTAVLLAKTHKVYANCPMWPVIPTAIDTVQKLGAVFCRIRKYGIAGRLQRLVGSTEFSWLEDVKPDLVVVSQGGSFDGVEWLMECGKRGIPYRYL